VGVGGREKEDLLDEAYSKRGERGKESIQGRREESMNRTRNGRKKNTASLLMRGKKAKKYQW